MVQVVEDPSFAAMGGCISLCDTQESRGYWEPGNVCRIAGPILLNFDRAEVPFQAGQRQPFYRYSSPTSPSIPGLGPLHGYQDSTSTFDSLAVLPNTAASQSRPDDAKLMPPPRDRRSSVEHFLHDRQQVKSKKTIQSKQQQQQQHALHIVRATDPSKEVSVDGFIVPEHLRPVVERDVFDREKRCASQPFGPPLSVPLAESWESLSVRWCANSIRNGNTTIRYTYADDATEAGATILPILNSTAPTSESPLSTTNATTPTYTSASDAIPTTTTQSRRLVNTTRHDYMAPISASPNQTLLSAAEIAEITDPVLWTAHIINHSAARDRTDAQARQGHNVQKRGGLMQQITSRHRSKVANAKKSLEEKLERHKRAPAGCGWEERAAEGDAEGGDDDHEGSSRIVGEYEAALMAWEANISQANGGAECAWWESRWREREKKSVWWMLGGMLCELPLR